MADAEKPDDVTGEAVAADPTEPEPETTSELIEALSKPIAGDSPCGESVAYEDDFETIKTEIDKLSDHDFELVADLSLKLLTDKTKDILVAAYLSVGLTMTQGLSGLAEGLGVMNMLCDKYWDDVFPPKKRMAARRSAIQFFAERATGALASLKPTLSDRAKIEMSLSRLARLQEFTMSEMGDQAPVLSGLKRAVEEVQRRLPKEKPAATATEASETSKPDEPGGAATTAPAARAEISSASDANTAVAKAATFLRESDKTNPVSYRLLRSLRWSQIKVEPPNEGGKTRLPAPIEQRRTYLEGLLTSGESEKLIEEGEASFQAGSFHLWLDLQRLVAGAMGALGEPYAATRQAIVEETAILLRRVPSLASLSFSDGTPFASGVTDEWLRSEVLAALDGGQTSAATQVARAEDSGRLEEQQREASKKLQKGDLAGALAVMQEGSDHDKSAKDRFRRQLYLAGLCMQGGKAAVARPILENLDKEIGRHGLDTWDPDLALEVWSNLYRCYQAITKAAAATEKASLKEDSEDIFEKICRLDASFALTLSGKK